MKLEDLMIGLSGVMWGVAMERAFPGGSAPWWLFAGVAFVLQIAGVMRKYVKSQRSF